jgi:hypothetical protein
LFSIETISLGAIIDSDEILAKVSQNLASNPNYLPRHKDLIKFLLSPLGRVIGDRETFCRKVARLAGFMFNKPGLDKNLGLSTALLIKFLDKNEIVSLTGLDVKQMNELYEFLSNGERSINIAKINDLMAANEAAELKTAKLEAAKKAAELEAAKKAAEHRAKVAELKAAKEAAELKAEKEAAVRRAEAAEHRATIIQIVLKMSRNNTNLSEIARITGLSVEDVEQILS